MLHTGGKAHVKMAKLSQQSHPLTVSVLVVGITKISQHTVPYCHLHWGVVLGIMTVQIQSKQVSSGNPERVAQV